MKSKRVMKWALVLGPIVGSLLMFSLTYWTWCQGWWGKDSEFWQNLFQCRCPAITEAVRYQPFKVLSSACSGPALEDLSPSGRFVMIAERQSQRLVVFDMKANRELSFPLRGGRNRFLNESLVVSKSPDDATILNIEDGTQITIPVVTFDEGTGQKLDDAILQIIRNSEQVFVVENEFIVALSSHEQSVTQNILINPYGASAYREVLTIIVNEGIPIKFLSSQRRQPDNIVLDGVSRTGLYSPDKVLWADGQGIYLIANGQPITLTGGPPKVGLGNPAPYFVQEGWVINNWAVVYSRYFVGGEFFASHTLQPVLLLEVPQRYWVVPTTAP
jgi:hypothetical protein